MKNSTQLQFTPQLRPELIFKPLPPPSEITLPVFCWGPRADFSFLACVCTGVSCFFTCWCGTRADFNGQCRLQDVKTKKKTLGDKRGASCDEGFWLCRNVAMPIQCCCYGRGRIDVRMGGRWPRQLPSGKWDDFRCMTGVCNERCVNCLCRAAEGLQVLLSKLSNSTNSAFTAVLNISF